MLSEAQVQEMEADARAGLPFSIYRVNRLLADWWAMRRVVVMARKWRDGGGPDSADALVDALAALDRKETP